jgi:hypothetical protein
MQYLYNVHASIEQPPPLRDRPLQLVLDLQPSRNLYRCLALAYRRPLTLDDFLRLYLTYGHGFNGVQQVGFHFGQEVSSVAAVPPGALFMDLQFDPTNLDALPSNVTSPIQLQKRPRNEPDVDAAAKRPAPSPPSTPPPIVVSS